MTKLPHFLSPGVRSEIGSYQFTSERIIDFASRYDPQPFHMDEEKAKQSLFGGLCASGWHTASAWMKMQREFIERKSAELTGSNDPTVTFGPSPGFENLKWLRPVFAGETVTYFNTVTDIRPTSKRPDWWVLTALHEGFNQSEQPVLSFESSVLVHISG